MLYLWLHYNHNRDESPKDYAFMTYHRLLKNVIPHMRIS